MTESNSVVDPFRQREFAALATVVSVEGSSYRRPGARMLITESGETTGVLSGGCLERDVCDRAQKVMRSGTPVVVRYDTTNGNIDVFIEVVQPRVRLVVFGAGPDVLPIVDLAKYLSWHTTVVDTSARVSSRERFSKADVVLLCRPEDMMSQVSLSERTSVVVMTHNYLHDLELVQQLLPLPLRYLGCLGPRQRTERLLNEASGDTRYLRRLHAPVGLDIGAETAEEIALSIVSEIKAVLSQRSGAQLRERLGSIHGWSDMTPVAFSREVWASAPSF